MKLPNILIKQIFYNNFANESKTDNKVHFYNKLELRFKCKIYDYKSKILSSNKYQYICYHT